MSDLTTEEQAHVRTALRFLRTRCGSWDRVAVALRMNDSTLGHIVHDGRSVGAGLAVRVARFASVPVDDVLSGKYPAAGSCPYCGRPPDGPTPEAAR